MTQQDTSQLIFDNAVPASPSRNYGIDLLRMLSMYLICMHHTLLYGGFLGHAGEVPYNYNIALFFNVVASCAVNCFALISGYVGIKSKFKYRNLFRLWLQAFCYSAGISLIFYFAKPGSVGLIDLLKSFLPICSQTYWYLTAYALMFFAIPQMNFILEKQDKKDVKIFLWTFFLLFSLCSLSPIIMGIATPVFKGYSAIWLAYLYVVGGFIRLHGVAELFSHSLECKASKMLSSWILAAFDTQTGRAAVYILCILMIFLIRTGGPVATKLLCGREGYFNQFVFYNSPFVLCASIALLEIFSHSALPRLSAFIRFASPLAFGVYLIHDQYLIRNYIISDAFAKFATISPFILPVAIIVLPLSIYVICSAIDYLRLMIFRYLATLMVPR